MANNMKMIKKALINDRLKNLRFFSTSKSNNAKSGYKLLIVGGGTGGIATSAKFVKALGSNNVAVIDPSDWHYYQPGWTMVGAGLKTADDVRSPQKNCIPKGVDWLKTHAISFDPENRTVKTADGRIVNYDYLVVASGISIDFDGIKGLNEALTNDPDHVVSIYSHESVKKVFPAIKSFKGGEAVFTFPKVPIKCPGAPQKIMYMAEDFFRQNNVRHKSTVSYYTTLPVIFGVKKYAASLMNVVKERDIKLFTRKCLTEIDYKNRTALFEDLDQPGSIIKKQYDLLHVCPPMKPYDSIANSKLVDQTGYVDVNKLTLQHKKYSNVFGIGDCTNVPTSKTAAAIAAQSDILFENLSNVMNGKETKMAEYDGYTSCPLVTGYGKLILAEFDFDGNPLETFPVDQGKERRFFYHLKKDFMPPLYWYPFLKGLWGGPKFFRKAFGGAK